MNTGLLIAAVALSGVFVLLLAFSFIYAHMLRVRVAEVVVEAPLDLTNEAGEIDPAKYIQHLKKSTAEFGIKYAELRFGKLLGKGSQGEVFKANWRGSTVAVKKVDTRKVPPEIIEEFCAEAQIMRRLRHPTLTLFMGVSLEHPHLCIVTELVARGSLFDIIHDEHAALTWARCLGIAADVARGMTYLHAHSPPILHRDLKSLNILIDENWRGKVADFGMTRFQEDGTMTQCGSPLWMSPEMVRNDPYDEKSDVYSFAICLWEMYTRKIPYRDLGLNPSHLVVKVVKEHLRPPIPKQCPRAFRQLMERCWNPVAEKRPTFPQILKTIEAFLADPAILNHKPMSSRESHVIVRPDRVAEDKDAAALGFGAVGAMEAAWKLDAKDVTFVNEAATFQDANGSDGGAETPAAGAPAGKRKASQTPLSSEVAASPHRRALSATSADGRTTPSDGAEPSRSRVAPQASVDASPSGSVPRPGTGGGVGVESAPAPLVLNTSIKATKDEDGTSSTAPLASQGPGILVGRFRGKVVGVKPCFIARSHLVLSNEERVAADLDGRLQDTKVGALMKRLASLRHPNLTLLMGAYVDTVANLRTKLRESGAAVQIEQPPTEAPASKSAVTLPPLGSSVLTPPPECDYYLGVVQEMMSRGTLHDVLCDAALVVDFDTLLQLLIDAASAMAYLHGNQPHPVIHQDLTSRRLLVDKNWRVKVTEHGGLVDLHAHLSGVAMPPTPWSAPEYIKHPTPATLTPAANVYQFGLIMWQALVRKPLWDNRPLTKDLVDRIVKQGDRPILPSSLTMHADLRQLIEKTWMADPHARPTFATILDELHRLKKLGPPKIELQLGVNAHMYRKAKTVFAYRSKDPVTILKDWGTNLGKRGCVIIFSGEDDVYLCDEEVFDATYERLDYGEEDAAEPAPALTPGGGTATDSRPNTGSLRPSDPSPSDDHRHEYRKTGTVLARCMSEAFSLKTNGGTEHGMAGDYLVQNEGDQWSIDAKTFVELYERAN